MVIEHGQELFIVDVPEGSSGLVFAEKPQVRQKLAEAYLGGQLG